MVLLSSLQVGVLYPISRPLQANGASIGTRCDEKLPLRFNHRDHREHRGKACYDIMFGLLQQALNSALEKYWSQNSRKSAFSSVPSVVSVVKKYCSDCPVQRADFRYAWAHRQAKTSETMRDVVVIGGGLSGLAACYQLEKSSLRYTVIEVKRRFGGGIKTRAERGFVMDAGSFVLGSLADAPWLAELGLCEQTTPVADDAFVFRAGAESLIQALASSLQGGRLMRMAVSSVGRWRGRFTICLENGLVYDAGALILAVPARYAARILLNLAPEAADRLDDFRYDSIWRVSLGCQSDALPPAIADKLDSTCRFILSTDAPGRVPDRQHRLLQVGVRAAPHAGPESVVRDTIARLGFSAEPIVARADHWPEADLRSRYDAAHRQTMSEVHALLPAGLTLIGSDYCLDAPTVQGIARLNERIGRGGQAAQAAEDVLKARRRR